MRIGNMRGIFFYNLISLTFHPPYLSFEGHIHQVLQLSAIILKRGKTGLPVQEKKQRSTPLNAPPSFE